MFGYAFYSTYFLYKMLCKCCRVSSPGDSTRTHPDPVVPAAETVLMDGTDGRWKKRCVLFLFKVLYSFFVRMGPNWTDISVHWMHLSERPSAKKDTLHLSPKLSIAPVCPNLSIETYPHACNNERAARDRNHGTKHVNENQYLGNLCSCTFNQPK